MKLSKNFIENLTLDKVEKNGMKRKKNSWNLSNRNWKEHRPSQWTILKRSPQKTFIFLEEMEYEKVNLTNRLVEFYISI